MTKTVSEAEYLELLHSHIDKDYLIEEHRKANDKARTLLNDALHALENGHPEITQEYLERVIRNLTKVQYS